MLVTREGGTATVEMEDTDFIDAGVTVASPNERGFPYDTGELTADGATMTITFKMSASAYGFIASVASGERVFESSGFNDNEARRMSDEFLNGNLQIADYTGQYDLEDGEASAAIDLVNVERELVFTGDFIAGATYILRADVGVRDIQFYLIPATLFVDPTPSNVTGIVRNTYVDSYAITIPSDEDDAPVSDSILMKQVVAFKVGIIEKDVTLSGRGKVLNIMPLLIGIVHRYGYNYGEVKKLYENSLDLFSKFGFIDLPTVGGTHIPTGVYGVVNSADAFAIVDLTGVSMTTQGHVYTITGTMSVKYVVGDIRWPTQIDFIEPLPTFDLLSDGDIEWEKFGPIRNDYIDGSSVPQAECMHSWEGRGTMGIKMLTKTAANIQD